MQAWKKTEAKWTPVVIERGSELAPTVINAARNLDVLLEETERVRRLPQTSFDLPVKHFRKAS